MPAGEIRIRGQHEVEAAFLAVRKEVLVELRPALRKIGEVVARDAERRADSSITNIGAQWDRMRVGVVARGVYVAPKSRRRGGSPRKNLAGLLLQKAMQPALEDKKEQVNAEFTLLVNRASTGAGF